MSEFSANSNYLVFPPTAVWWILGDGLSKQTAAVVFPVGTIKPLQMVAVKIATVKNYNETWWKYEISVLFM